MRFASLYVFNVIVLLVIGWLTPARVGLHALWASVILTLATLFLKPLLKRAASSMSAGGTKLVQYLAVFVVEFVIWMLTVWLSGVRAGNIWGWVIPPLILLIGWVVYDQIDDVLTRKAGELSDAAGARISGSRSGDPRPRPPRHRPPHRRRRPPPAVRSSTTVSRPSSGACSTSSAEDRIR